MARIETPLRRVTGLGAAHAGTTQFWRQRLTGLANLFLAAGAIVIVAMAAGRPYPEVVAILGSPAAALILGLLILSAAIHMRLGMQVVIEDYIHGEGLKTLLLAANAFFSVAVSAAGVFAVLKLALGG